MIQESIEAIQEAMDVGLCVLDGDSVLAAAGFEPEAEMREAAAIFAKERTEYRALTAGQLFRIPDGTEQAYILAIQGSGSQERAIGKMAARQLTTLLQATRNRPDAEHYKRALLHGSLDLAEAGDCEALLGLCSEAARTVFLIETKKTEGSEVSEVLGTLYADVPGSLLLTEGEGRTALMLEAEEERFDPEQTAFLIVDMLNTEAMVQARVGYGSIVRGLQEVARSFREAETALHVGEIFYVNRKVISHRELGIGGLIYQMPVELCESFLQEVFAKSGKAGVDSDTLHIVYQFFGNNLNLSETSRQLYMHRNTLVYRLGKLQKLTGLDIRNFDDALVFRIALMVMDYLEYRKKNER